MSLVDFSWVFRGCSRVGQHRRRRLQHQLGQQVVSGAGDSHVFDIVVSNPLAVLCRNIPSNYSRFADLGLAIQELVGDGPGGPGLERRHKAGRHVGVEDEDVFDNVHVA
jgi:hypothetical protein